MDEIVKDFIIESGENLDRLDQELVKLESAPSCKELLASIFRTIHTIKGSCGFLGFARLEKVAHSGESLLSKLRDGELTLNAEITSGLLAMVDAVRSMLAKIQDTEQDGEDDYAALTAHLTELQHNSAKGEKTKVQPASAPTEMSPPQDVPASEHVTGDPNNPDAEVISPDPSKIGGVLIEKGQVRPEDLAKALQLQELGRHKVGEILIEQGAAKPEDVAAAQQTVQSRNPEAAADTIRVGVNLLDRLMNLVGELVLARNQLLQFSNSTQDAGFQAVSQRMNLIATELQEEVMKTRMQPIGNVWNKFPRTVRDLALSCGKDVRLEMEGQDTELDRTIIEAIKDPLTHLVRNCIDHGIELPETRKQLGKPSVGVLKLRAFHEGGQVNIEIIDDGAGLNVERIRQNAIERGLVPAQQVARMSDRDIFNMIFLPGFSTAEKVTKVSGRGVGMDVVKTNVEKTGGTVDVQSTAGKGTTVRIKIPLTLAIIPALMVTSCGERFAIPQVSLLGLVRLEANDANRAIEMVHGAPVHRLRGRLLPVVYLDRELHLVASEPNGTAKDGPTNIVVVQADGREFGLVVDEITDTEEIVVKPTRVPIIMFSTLTERGAQITLEALALGATDYVTKPSNVNGAATLEAITRELIPKIRALCRLRGGQNSLIPETRSPVPLATASSRLLVPAKIVVIGVSTGGPDALARLLPTLPANFPVPLLIAQHMPPIFTSMLASRLAAKSAFPVRECVPGEQVVPGCALIAPGDFHMVVQQEGGTVRVGTHQGPRENFCRPSVDVLFRSVAAIYGARTLAIILTGMGQDGLRGCEELRAQGARIYVQDEASCVVWGMPGFVARAGLADRVLPLPQIGAEIVNATRLQVAARAPS